MTRFIEEKAPKIKCEFCDFEDSCYSCVIEHSLSIHGKIEDDPVQEDLYRQIEEYEHELQYRNRRYG